MKRILIIKITSLGDIVMAQPVVEDLRRAYPGVTIDWACDAAFADIPTWNPGVSSVYSAPLRRFKQQRNWRGVKAILRTIRQMRQHRYDAVIDIHGAYKSAIVSFLARAERRYGYRTQDLGESGAAFAYSHRMTRPDGMGAVEGMRVCVAAAFGYTLQGLPHFGLRPPPGKIGETPAPRLAATSAVFLHGASKHEKEWPVAHWIETGRSLNAQGWHVVVPWHSEAEHQRAQEIVAALPAATLLPKLSIGQCAQMLAQAGLVIGVDTGLTHLAFALQRPSVMVFTATSHVHFGIASPGLAISLGDAGVTPTPTEVMDAARRVQRELLIAAA